MAKAGTDYRNSAVAIIKRGDGKVLIAFNKRINSLDRKNVEQNSYKFPQGGIDADERPEEAIIRELKEELGLDFTPFGIAARLDDYVSYWFKNTGKPDFEIRLFAFLFEIKQLDKQSLKPDPVEIAELIWVEPAEVKNLNLGLRHDAYLSILRRFNLI